MRNSIILEMINKSKNLEDLRNKVLEFEKEFPEKNFYFDLETFTIKEEYENTNARMIKIGEIKPEYYYFLEKSNKCFKNYLFYKNNLYYDKFDGDSIYYGKKETFKNNAIQIIEENNFPFNKNDLLKENWIKTFEKLKNNYPYDQTSKVAYFTFDNFAIYFHFYDYSKSKGSITFMKRCDTYLDVDALYFNGISSIYCLDDIKEKDKDFIQFLEKSIINTIKY